MKKIYESEKKSALAKEKPVSEEAASGQAADEKNSSANARAKKPSTKKLLIRFLIKLFSVIAIAVIIFTFVFCVNIHYGNNMHPAVRDGDLLISYRLQKPYLNAVVLYESAGKTCVGRVIALEGDEVNISEEGELTVNGIAPAEEVFYATIPAEGSQITYPYKVESGKAFILNDFRTDTNDSRAFGAVDIKNTKGALLLTLRHRDF